jgi:hypothetical protein
MDLNYICEVLFTLNYIFIILYVLSLSIYVRPSAFFVATVDGWFPGPWKAATIEHEYSYPDKKFPVLTTFIEPRSFINFEVSTAVIVQTVFFWVVI